MSPLVLILYLASQTPSSHPLAPSQTASSNPPAPSQTPAPPVNLEAERRAIEAADRAMAAATEARDIKLFLSFLAEDVVFLPDGAPLAIGREGVRVLWKRLFEPTGPSLTWRPSRAEVANSGDLGYTIGSFDLRGADPQGRPLTRSDEYVSVWRKQRDGAWRALFNIGRTPPPSAGSPLDLKRVREALSRAGDLAVSMGSYQALVPDPDGRMMSREGHYLTIRRKSVSGPWSVEVQVVTAPDTPPPGP